MGGDLSVILKSLSCETWANHAPSHLKCSCPSCCECDLSGGEESNADTDNDDNNDERSNTSKSSNTSRKSSKKLTNSRKHSKNNLNDK